MVTGGFTLTLRVAQQTEPRVADSQLLFVAAFAGVFEQRDRAASSDGCVAHAFSAQIVAVRAGAARGDRRLTRAKCGRRRLTDDWTAPERVDAVRKRFGAREAKRARLTERCFC